MSIFAFKLSYVTKDCAFRASFLERIYTRLVQSRRDTRLSWKDDERKYELDVLYTEQVQHTCIKTSCSSLYYHLLNLTEVRARAVVACLPNMFYPLSPSGPDGNRSFPPFFTSRSSVMHMFPRVGLANSGLQARSRGGSDRPNPTCPILRRRQTEDRRYLTLSGPEQLGMHSIHGNLLPRM